jgi:transmembrane sensor
MNYAGYQPEDFLADESFINYCYLSNEQDVAKWESIINQHPAIVNKVTEAKKMIPALQFLFAKEQAHESGKEFRKQFYTKNTTLAKDASFDTPAHKLIILKLKWFAAAALLLLLTAIFIVTLYINKNRKNIAAVAANTSYVTTAAERETIRLADGSKVLLNYNSTLTINKNYGKQQRMVQLSGEGFFEVKKNTSKPFIVITTNNSTIALGTSFMVRQYAHEANWKVELVTGKVNVSNNKQQQTILYPGQKAFENNNGIQKSTFSIETFNRWKQNHIEFKNTPVNEVLAQVANYYGMILKNTPGKNNKHFTGVFHNKSIYHIMDVLALLNHFTYTINKHELIINTPS